MSDNTQLNPGTGGDVVATDDIGGVKYQRVKVNFGVDGVSTDVSSANPLPVVSSPASNAWGQSIAVVAGVTATLVNITSATSGYQVRGLVAHGTGDGYWFLQVSNVTVLSGRTRATSPTLVLSLPNGIAVTQGFTVTLKVTNESGSTADYEATLLGA